MQKMCFQVSFSKFLHLLPIAIEPKDQLAFAVEVRALSVSQLLREGLPGIAEGPL